MSNVVEMVRAQEPKLIMGLIPSASRFHLGIAWPMIQPGLAELSQESLGEWDPWEVFLGIYHGSMQLHMAYLDRTGEATNEKFQEVFVEKLKTPEKDFVGFTVIQLLPKATHIFAAYIMPDYRGTNVLEVGFKFLESEIRKTPCPYISLSTRPDVSGALRRLGFQEAYMTYRKKL